MDFITLLEITDTFLQWQFLHCSKRMKGKHSKLWKGEHDKGQYKSWLIGTETLTSKHSQDWKEKGNIKEGQQTHRKQTERRDPLCL